MRATVAEKLLVALLAKLANPEPDASAISRQCPKMIDVGNGLGRGDMSNVMVADLWRLIAVCQELFTASEHSVFLVTQEVKAFIDAMHAILAAHRLDLHTSASDEQRRVMTELLEQTAGAYRWSYYRHGFSGQVAELRSQYVLALLDLVQGYANQMLGRQQNTDGGMYAQALPS
jgi:hypothetical protein